MPELSPDTTYDVPLSLLIDHDGHAVPPPDLIDRLARIEAKLNSLVGEDEPNMCSALAIRGLTRHLIREALVDDSPALKHYVRLVLITETPVKRAVTYLRDTGRPDAAKGRLLLRAAERALRTNGEIDQADYEDKGKGVVR